MPKKVGWTLMAVLACSVGAYALVVLLLPAVRQPLVDRLLTRTPWPAVGHLTAGSVAIVAGALQVNGRLRTRHLAFHRWLGRMYVIAVVAGGISAFLLATRSSGGAVAHFGFGLLAVCWLASTLTAYRMIRAGDQVAHRAWMLRSYALTLAAVTLRIYLPLSLVRGIPFDTAYPTIAWLCWVPNLVLVEWWILARRRPVPSTV